MYGTECRFYHLKNNSKGTKDDKGNCFKARKSTVRMATVTKLLCSSNALPHCLITPILIRGHIAGYGDISFILQHLTSLYPALGHIPHAPSHDGCVSSLLDELDVWTYSFPKPGHWPGHLANVQAHFDTMSTCEITQCRNMESKDKISNSAVSCLHPRKRWVRPQIRPDTCYCQTSSDLRLS